MRSASVLLLAVLGACYRPTGETTCAVTCTGPGSPCPGAMQCGANRYCEQPGGPTCGPGGEEIDAFVPDGPPMQDAMPDGLVTGPCVVATGHTSDTAIVPAGQWFIGDHASQRAMMFDGTELRSYEGNYDIPGGTYVRPVVAPVGTTHNAPRLSLGGAEMYLKVTVSGSLGFGVSTRTGANAWTQPAAVEFKEGGQLLQFNTSDSISPPTLTNPRRLVISSTSGYEEFTETSSVLWNRVLTVSASTLGGVSFLGEAALSPDGLKMTFRGQNGTNLISAFYVTRTALTQSFSGLAVEIPHSPSLSVQTPFLSGDCKHFYYTSNMGDVRHVVLP